MPNHSTNQFPVVGIGSSAGGYDAIKRFFSRLPDEPGMAIIIIQHITQDYKELSRQLISQLTNMSVEDAVEQATIEINKVYITPLNKLLTLEQDRFKLNAKVKHIAMTHPIDILFNALGHELKERAVGIILSGKGTDGSRGIRTIAEAGGLVIAQAPTTAQYSGMPEMAISSGYADHVLAPEDMPAKLKENIQRKKRNKEEEINISSEVTDIQNIIELLSNFSKVNFNHYKINSIVRRIEKRMVLTRQNSAAAYVRYLKENPTELTILYKNSLIGVTGFFRDPESFKTFEEIVVPEVCQQKDKYEQLRIWVPACATGEEAYSIAILLDKYIQSQQLKIDYKIFATDLDNAALEFASLGRYAADMMKDVPPELAEKYFEKDDTFYAVHPNIRKKIIFVKHNLLQDPPFIRLDIISCRNLFIYLKADVQRKISQVFHYALRPYGYLMLGNNEFIDENYRGFERVDARHKIFRSREGEKFRPNFFDTEVTNSRVKTPVNTPHHEKASFQVSNPAENITELLLQEYAPACVVLNKEGEVLYLQGDVEKYMKLPRNRMSTSIYHMANKVLLPVIRNGIRKVNNGERSVLFKDIFYMDGEEKLSTNIHMKPLVDEEKNQQLLLIEFGNIIRDTTKTVQVGELRTENFSQEYINDLETELKLTKQELQYTGQELEAAREELQASNEEMMSSNEELQSTNEELQSSNEELYSVNSELKHKVDELTILNNDINNLFQSTDIGIIFLDENLRIRKFTPSVSLQFNIREVDPGRPILELNQNFEYKDFGKKLWEILHTGHSFEKEVKNKNGRYYLMRVIPYHTDAPDTSGVIISFVDISEIKKANNQLKRLTRELKRSEGNLQSVIDNTPDVIMQYNRHLKLQFITQSVENLINLRAGDAIGKRNAEIGLFYPKEAERLDEKLQQVIDTQHPEDFYTSFHYNHSEIYVYIKLAPEYVENNEIQSVLAIARDITPLKEAEIKLQNKNEELERINSYLDEFVYAIAHDLRSPVANLKNIVTLMVEADEKRKTQLIGLLDKSVFQLDKTLNGLVDMIDAQAEAHNKKESCCHFQEIWADIQTELADTIAESGAELSVNFEKVPEANYIQTFLQSVMRNLLSNALKYRSNDRKLKITIKTEKVDDHILLSVEDNGIGINLEKHGQQIFKPFKRFVTEREGKGIGLHIIKNMVERNGGRIEVESKEGEGTRFKVFLKEY